MDMRQQILAEAERLFAARGYDGATIQDVADAVGIKKPSLLYHFPSKAELHRQVLERMVGHWQEALPRLLLAATSGQGRFDSLTRELVGFFTENPDRARLLLREALDRPEELRGAIQGHVTPWVAAVCDYIRAGQAEGGIHPDVDPEAYVTHVVSLVISSVATFETLGALVGAPVGSPAEGPAPLAAARARHLAELLRVARASLFVPRAARAAAPRRAEHEATSPDGAPPASLGSRKGR